MKPLITLVSALTLLGSLSAQTVYDDFNGPTINSKVWHAEGPKLKQANGKLAFDITATANEESFSGVVSYGGFQGNFDITVDFDSYAPNMITGDAGFELYIEDLHDITVNQNAVSVEINAGQNWMTISSFQVVNGAESSKRYNTIASSGQFRIKRTASAITAFARTGSQTSWTVVANWQNLLHDRVQITLAAWAGSNDTVANQGTLTINCDKVSFIGTRVAGPYNYGSTCHDMIAFRNGLATIGNNTFGIAFQSDTPLANSPYLLLFGLPTAAVDLSFFGAPGCALHTSNMIALPMGITNQEGSGLAKLPVPNNANLIGVNFGTQILVQAAVNNLGFTTSNGVNVTLIP